MRLIRLGLLSLLGRVYIYIYTILRYFYNRSQVLVFLAFCPTPPDEEQPFEPDGPKTVEARDVEQRLGTSGRWWAAVGRTGGFLVDL